jgi:ABC-type Fe3+-hydroxamate transport system substrate-binding protein
VTTGSPGLTDDLGAAVWLPGPPSRMVSLVPSLTEAVEVTAPGRLVGVTDYCTHPPGLELPRVGGSKYPDVAAVLACEPDLVLANAEENRPEDVAALRAAGVPVWVTEAAATVPVGLASVRRMLTEALGVAPPGWLAAAETDWAELPPVTATAIVPVWRKPWVLVGGRTFAGDVLRRLGVANAYADHPDRYPRPRLAELRAALAGDHAERRADLVVLPDEPYRFTPEDGPEAFPGARCAFLDGRLLTWCGPSLAGARPRLLAQLAP